MTCPKIQISLSLPLSLYHMHTQGYLGFNFRTKPLIKHFLQITPSTLTHTHYHQIHTYMHIAPVFNITLLACVQGVSPTLETELKVKMRNRIKKENNQERVILSVSLSLSVFFHTNTEMHSNH